MIDTKSGNFTKFKELRLTLDGLYYKGYEIRSACSSTLIDIIYKENSELSAIKKIVLNIFSTNIAHRSFSNELKKNNIKNIFTCATTREYHYELITSYINIFKVQSSSFIFNICNKRKLDINLKLFIYCLWHYFLKNSFQQTISNRLIIFSSIFHTVSEIESLKREFNWIDSDYNYIAFNSAWGSENIYTQFFNNRKCKTFSLQHAMYYEFIGPIPLDTINYLNIQAKYFLAWGQYTQDQIGKFLSNDTKILKVGNPLFTDNLTHNKKINVKPGVESIFIPLPRVLYLNEVKALLILLSHSKYLSNSIFYIRLHPSWNKELFLSLVPSLIKENFFIDDSKNLYSSINNIKFSLSITFNTSAVFELLNFSDRLLIYNTQVNEFKVSELKAFHDLSSLEKILNTLPFNKVSKEYFFSDSDLTIVNNLLEL